MNTNYDVLSILSTDQIKTIYTLWKTGRHNDTAVFDLFFRRETINGKFVVFVGLDELLEFVNNLKINTEDTNFLKDRLANIDPLFFDWLEKIDGSNLKIYAVPEGTIVFPRTPVIRIEGSLAVCKLIGIALKMIVKYPSFVTTNATRLKLVAGSDIELYESSVRRALDTRSAIIASRCSYLGGFIGTSNAIAGPPFKDFHDHEFVLLYNSLGDLKETKIIDSTGVGAEFVEIVQEFRKKLNFTNTHEGELAAFIASAQTSPSEFLALVDTYNTLESGIPNFLCVALALREVGYKAFGIHLDSGDLVDLSKKARKLLNFHYSENLKIVASNDVNELFIQKCKQQDHEMDILVVASHLADYKYHSTWECFYKIVEINGHHKIKLSHDVEKTVILGRKNVYRLFDEYGIFLVDVMLLENEDPPKVGERFFCRYPFNPVKASYVTPGKVILLNKCVYDGKQIFSTCDPSCVRDYIHDQLKIFKKDLLEPEKQVLVSGSLYELIHKISNEIYDVRQNFK